VRKAARWQLKVVEPWHPGIALPKACLWMHCAGAPGGHVHVGVHSTHFCLKQLGRRNATATSAPDCSITWWPKLHLIYIYISIFTVIEQMMYSLGLVIPEWQRIYLLIYLFVYLHPTYLSIYLSTYLSFYLPIYVYLPIHLSIYHYLPIY
jgi:hypothetical protein